MADDERRFEAEVEPGPRGSAYVRLPFHPADAWGNRERYHVTGRLGWFGIRGPLAERDGGFVVTLGAAWLRDCPVKPGMTVPVVLAPEGAQLADLDEDVAAALAAAPEAARFFEALAQFYRKAYLKWLDGAKRRPELRKERLREFVALLKAERKSR
jgi:bacteriocin resistance YdeI/OmpD-like protein/uncharacterized protein DUF1905